MLLAFSSRASKDYWIEFEFVEDVIITGFIISVEKESRVESLRVRANKDKNQPYWLERVLPEDVVRK